MFKRVLDWVNNLADFRGHSIRLAHGKAQFNEDYQSLKHFEGSSNIGLDDDDSDSYMDGLRDRRNPCWPTSS